IGGVVRNLGQQLDHRTQRSCNNSQRLRVIGTSSCTTACCLTNCIVQRLCQSRSELRDRLLVGNGIDRLTDVGSDTLNTTQHGSRIRTQIGNGLTDTATGTTAPCTGTETLLGRCTAGCSHTTIRRREVGRTTGSIRQSCCIIGIRCALILCGIGLIDRLCTGCTCSQLFLAKRLAGPARRHLVVVQCNLCCQRRSCSAVQHINQTTVRSFLLEEVQLRFQVTPVLSSGRCILEKLHTTLTGPLGKTQTGVVVLIRCNVTTFIVPNALSAIIREQCVL